MKGKRLWIYSLVTLDKACLTLRFGLKSRSSMKTFSEGTFSYRFHTPMLG